MLRSSKKVFQNELHVSIPLGVELGDLFWYLIFIYAFAKGWCWAIIQKMSHTPQLP
jgi:hypothetical protein